MDLKTADFDFFLPENMVASRPAEKRDHSRLLMLSRNGSMEHKRFHDIVDYLNSGDMLLLNETKVFPARLIGTKPSGGKIDILLVREIENEAWEIMCRGNYTGMITIGDSIRAEIWAEEKKKSEVKKFLRFRNIEYSEIKDILWRLGHMPLPPYIRRKPDNEDKQRYQTVYARNEGSIAAPTAGLHFTEELLMKIKDKGVLVKTLTLHVGTGTFKPVKTEYLKTHLMDTEYFEIKSSLIDEMRQVKEAGNRVITVGTTATRAVEGYLSGHCSVVNNNGSICGYTDVFIYPEYKFKVLDGLLTNFHLPRSTPLMLASAFCGLENILNAYEEAIAMGYRFFSYGDAMLIL
ncbi:MAG: tRNA preQ1(34) S-adenosylmethionine ribosyltransferase-isomerase QueA [Thermodesulfovibrionales bacterium]|nr:tRNA preQ1(34) S-adenosylmethionine ribosyltransferase-isomerase QueA [Thermodesulfovibrionales bacterium]